MSCLMKPQYFLVGCVQKHLYITFIYNVTDSAHFILSDCVYSCEAFLKLIIDLYQAIP